MNNSWDLLNVDLLRNGSFNETVNSSLVSPFDTYKNIISIGIVFCIMVGLGCTMEVSKIKAHILKPKGVGIAVVSQYGIMPLTAFCLAKAFHLTDMPAVVVLICGCCPGGTLSNIMSLALKGDMNLSIVMTTCSTVLAFGMMPLLLLLYCQGFDNLTEAVPYLGIMRSLVATLVPCVIGILINYFRPQYAKIAVPVFLGISSLGFIAFLVLTCLESGVGGLIIDSPKLLSIAFLMPMIGYILGYIISSVFRLTQPERRTVAMETGCQNGQLCLAIIKVAFSPVVMGNLFLFPLTYIVAQFSEALAMVMIFRGYQLWTIKKAKKVYQPANTAVEEVKVSSEQVTVSQMDLS